MFYSPEILKNQAFFLNFMGIFMNFTLFFGRGWGGGERGKCNFQSNARDFLLQKPKFKADIHGSPETIFSNKWSPWIIVHIIKLCYNSQEYLNNIYWLKEETIQTFWIIRNCALPSSCKADFFCFCWVLWYCFRVNMNQYWNKCVKW